MLEPHYKSQERTGDPDLFTQETTQFLNRIRGDSACPLPKVGFDCLIAFKAKMEQF